MFNNEIRRIGFACKIQKAPDVAVPGLNTSTTTIKWLSGQTTAKAHARLWELTKANIAALEKQIQWVGARPHNQRMFRITSDLLPAYTYPDYWEFYQSLEMTSWLERNLGRCGDLARQLDVRLSFHPGQFCVLASDNPNVVENSIEEFEYHTDVIRYMGFGKTFQDFKCNVHIGGKQGPKGIKLALKKLSREARNCLTIENAEFSWGLDASLELAKDCALVLDIHHHWIMTGEYIEPDDTKLQSVQESWRGVRPVIHYSVSREDCLIEHDKLIKPDMQQLKQLKFTSAKLRAHSEMYWNLACNDWALSHSNWADIMCEAKQKNIASEQLAAGLC